MYYIKYNGIDLTNIIKVKEVEIPSLPSIEHSSINVFERDGSIYNGASHGNRNIRLTFIINPDDALDYDMYINDVKRAFYTKEEAQLYCGDDTLYIWCVPVGDVTITQLGDYCSEGEVELVAYDPYWHSTEYQTANNNSNTTFLAKNNSDVPIYPIINVGFTKDTTFFQVENKSNGEKILIGGIPSVEGTTIKKNTKIFNDSMKSTVGWSNSTAAIDSGRSIGGTISVTTAGRGLMCGDFGSSTDGNTWHGACYRKTIDTPVRNFRVKARMGHNSSGVNGDPEHPYTNDSESVISGTKVTYYQVSTASGVILRKSASIYSEKLSIIPYGTELTGQLSDGWLSVTYNEMNGYCDTKDLRIVVRDNTVTTTQCNYVTVKATAIRATASESATNKKTIPAGECIRVITSVEHSDADSGNTGDKYFELAKPYEGVTGYVLINCLTEANEYTVDYDYELITADDKTGIVELYGFSSNNVQLFRMGLYDDNEYWEFTYPMIRKNSEDFLCDKTLAPEAKTITTYDNNSKNVTKVLSGEYGDWNGFYGDLYIERINNLWYAYVQKIKDGAVVKEIKSKSITDTNNANESLSYLVIDFGTTGNASKASGMCIYDLEVESLTDIDNTVSYNFQQFGAGDILTIDNSIPRVTLNGVEHNELIDIGSSFFPLEPGYNTIKYTSDDNPVVDVIWSNKYL